MKIYRTEAPKRCSYDRTSAINYAQKWALDHNPDFPNYSSGGGFGGGGDCANFVSQAMCAGGWPMLDFSKYSPLGWWAEKTKTHRNWASAGRFADHIEFAQKAKICARSELDLGDLVTVGMFDRGVTHVVIITSLQCSEDGTVYRYCGHSTNRFNHPLEMAEEDYGTHNFLYWKVADTIAGGMGIW